MHAQGAGAAWQQRGSCERRDRAELETAGVELGAGEVTDRLEQRKPVRLELGLQGSRREVCEPVEDHPPGRGLHDRVLVETHALRLVEEVRDDSGCRDRREEPLSRFFGTTTAFLFRGERHLRVHVEDKVPARRQSAANTRRSADRCAGDSAQKSHMISVTRSNGPSGSSSR